ncbi:DUF6456 domain-containing protein [Methyloligella sp. 2.7D]|uniref:DUF6456 domain-containing protein n=1 Tax=unclassified Methyloligella TaxID=2625955 RepID=UPI00157C7EA2|nr:DUF6456 domain-containing protein [Methyloligella sp. GL2]QKP77092.1 hypothetical protein HT051_06265 [Methyloligella sp. GL2]
MSGAGKTDEAGEAAALRLLHRLREADGVLVREGDMLRIQPGGAGKLADRREVTPGLAHYCVGRDWLALRGQVLVLTEAGRARLRRQQAGNDDFRQQHQIRGSRDVEMAGTRRPVVVNDAESPLGWLRRRKDRDGNPLISAEQYEAGERLRDDYWFAHLTPRVTASWGALAPSETRRRAAPTDAAQLRDDVLAAKRRVFKALEAAGPELAGVLVDVCCELRGLEESEKAQGWPQRAGKVVLQIALTRLARHYGLLAEDRRGYGRLSHWGTEDYRPTMEAWAGPSDP